MLTAKADWIAFNSLWHYFCALKAPQPVYLTVIDNIYPIKELLSVQLRIQDSELEIDNSVHCALCSVRKE
jgi:hypothetical protein